MSDERPADIHACPADDAMFDNMPECKMVTEYLVTKGTEYGALLVMQVELLRRVQLLTHRDCFLILMLDDSHFPGSESFSECFVFLRAGGFHNNLSNFKDETRMKL